MLCCLTSIGSQIHPRKQLSNPDDEGKMHAPTSKVFGPDFEQAPPHSHSLHWALYNTHTPHLASTSVKEAAEGDGAVIRSSKTDLAPSMVLIGSNKTDPGQVVADSFPLTHKSSGATSANGTPLLRFCSTPSIQSPETSSRLATIAESEATEELRNGVTIVSRATQSDTINCNSLSNFSSGIIPSRFKKGQVLGCGSSGTVYQIFAGDTGELLALKEVSRQDLIEVAEKEARLMSSLSDHPNVVRYRGMRVEETRPLSGASERNLLVFLEWMPGGSVAQLINNYGPLEEGVAKRMTGQILHGLDFLHRNKIIHRDVKGSNILLSANGNVKLGDLGSSKSFASSGGSGGLVTEEVAMSFKGSAFWISPEVIKSQGHTFSCDIYSLGCTILEMLSGRPPWVDETEGPLQALMLIATMDEAGLAERLRPPLTSSALCVDFIRQCTRLDPWKRPTALALLQHPWLATQHIPG